MHDLEVIIPVKNEAGSIMRLVERIHKALYAAKISYRITFVDDHSTDDTTYQINIISGKYTNPFQYSFCGFNYFTILILMEL